MKTSFTVSTPDKTSVTNVTDKVKDAVSGMADGTLQVRIPHTTAAIFLAEDDEELREDYVKIVTHALAPLRPFKHIRKNNPNTEAHVWSSLLGTTLSLVVEDGELLLGTYQNILLLDMDGPKERTVNVHFFPLG